MHVLSSDAEPPHNMGPLQLDDSDDSTPKTTTTIHDAPDAKSDPVSRVEPSPSSLEGQTEREVETQNIRDLPPAVPVNRDSSSSEDEGFDLKSTQGRPPRPKQRSRISDNQSELSSSVFSRSDLAYKKAPSSAFTDNKSVLSDLSKSTGQPRRPSSTNIAPRPPSGVKCEL